MHANNQLVVADGKFVYHKKVLLINKCRKKPHHLRDIYKMIK